MRHSLKLRGPQRDGQELGLVVGQPVRGNDLHFRLRGGVHAGSDRLLRLRGRWGDGRVVSSLCRGLEVPVRDIVFVDHMDEALGVLPEGTGCKPLPSRPDIEGLHRVELGEEARQCRGLGPVGIAVGTATE